MPLLQAEVEGFNQRWGKHRGDASLVEFLALAQQAADSLFGQAFAKLASQVLVISLRMTRSTMRLGCSCGSECAAKRDRVQEHVCFKFSQVLTVLAPQSLQ